VHTSGVTERKSEIRKYKDIKSFEVADYAMKNQFVTIAARGFQQNYIFFLKTFLKKITLRLGFLSESNTLDELNATKPWVLSLRGHYTRIPFNTDSLRLLFELIDRNLDEKKVIKDNIGIQYRLGDLVSLENKSPVRPQSILTCIQKISITSNPGIQIFSDSLPLALDLLRPLIPDTIEIQGVVAEPDEAIILLSKLPYFIGTTAKLSVWVAVFRSLLLFQSNTYICSSFEKELNSHGVTHLVEYY